MNFWSRFVFGFLLAQVVPGVVGTYFAFFMSSLKKLFVSHPENGYIDYLTIHARLVTGDHGTLGISFVGALCFGVVLYWFNWLLLARLEQQVEASDLSGLENLPCHRRPPLVQILVWPIDLAGELFVLFLGTPSFDKMIRKERLTAVPPEKLTQFTWLEEYYLPFALFLSNLQFALIPALGSVLYVFANSGFAFRRTLILVATYFAIGLVRLLARQQLISLGRAERELLEVAGE